MELELGEVKVLECLEDGTPIIVACHLYPNTIFYRYALGYMHVPIFMFQVAVLYTHTYCLN
jgi:hypothetical protein